MHQVIDVGEPVTMRALFISEAGAATDPVTITLTITKPDGTVVTVLKAAMTSTAVGHWAYTITTDQAGVWTYTFTPSAGAIQGEFFLVGIATHAGPCDDWVNPDDIFDCAGLSTIAAGDRDYGLAARVATVASEILYMATQRQFPGLCEDTIRPCGSPSCYDGSPTWSCGCGSGSTVRLPGPVRGIIDVRVDGAALARTAYRVNNLQDLERLDDDAWPHCQDLTANPALDLNTFQVHYLRGTPPPESGELAAQDLACDLYRGASGGDCKLPTKVTNIVRQGVTMSLVSPVDIGRDLATGELKTGIRSVEWFLAAYGLGGRRRRRGSIASPDVGRLAQRTGP